MPDHLRNPGYTAYGGCIAYGGPRATAGEFYDFNRVPPYAPCTHLTPLTHAVSLRLR